jgi:lipopolysaccharide transport system ATP-binding protein
LSGRENIYLNGAIMGLRKWEIDKKLDEIIDFAGVDRYLDTPVKRYSSGMYVRLAFAVAAHLDPDILIVDEVLAVGDAEFQKKCLGKMKDVSQGQGRTVLFVSHQMDAVSKLCKKSILLKNGNIAAIGDTREIIQTYLVRNRQNHSEIECLNNEFNVSTNVSKSYYKNRGIQLVRLFSNGIKSKIFHSGDNMKIEIDIIDTEYISDIKIGIVIKKSDQTPIIGVNNFHYSTPLLTIPQKSSTIVIEFEKLQIIGEGLYYADLFLGDKDDDFDVINDAFYFEIQASNPLLGKSTLDSSLNSFYFENIRFSQQ